MKFFWFQFQNWIKANFTLSYRVCRQNLSIYIFEAQKKARNVYRVRDRNKKHKHTHIKYKPWRKLGQILRGRCTRASRVPRESIAGRGPWPMGTARWCPPEKHGWQFHSAPSVEEIALPPLNWVGVLRAMKGRRAGVDSLDGIHEDKKRKRAEATHAPLSSFPFQFSCCPDKFNRVLIFVGDAVSKWFPADRRRDALLSTAPSPSSIKIRRRGEPWVSFQSVMSPPTIQRGRSRCRFCTTLVLVAERLTTKFILGCCTWVWCLAEGINLSFSKRYDRNDSELYYGKERRLLSFALDIIGDNF